MKNSFLQQSDGEKSDQDLVVDDASEVSPISPMPNAHNSNGISSPRENGLLLKKMEHNDRDRVGPHSPRSGTSSNASTPSNKKLEEKPSTPLSKSVTPTNSNGTNGENSFNSNRWNDINRIHLISGDKNLPKPPVLNPNYPHYLAGVPPELQGGPYPGPVPGHNIPAGYPRPPLQMGFDAHPQMRAPPLAPAALGMVPAGGKA